jgi:parallel beta-helix repeat protein
MKNKKFQTALIIGLFLTIAIQPAFSTVHTLVPGTDTYFGTWMGSTFTFDASPTAEDSIQISTSDVTVDGNGFTLTGPGSSGVGVNILSYANGITVRNLSVTGFSYGIIVDSSNLPPAQPHPNVIQNNTISNATIQGIRLFKSNSTSLINNNISDSYIAIQLVSSGDTIVDGYDFANTISNNAITDNAGGIYLDGSTYNSLQENSVTGHSTSANGIYLLKSDNNTLTGNTSSNYNYGVRLRDSSNNILTNNTISDNRLYGIWLDPSNNNQIFNNNFLNNPTQAEVIDSTGNNFDGNYWSDWSGSGPYTFTGGQDNSPWAVQNGWLPLADAGPDRTVECACQTPAGTQVTLDGTRSTGASTYIWTGPFVESPATGATPTVTLVPGCLGDYVITLVVSSGQYESDPDTVTITVEDTNPPEISCPGDTTIQAMQPDGVPIDDDRIQTFLDGASATDNCDSPEDIVITNDAPALFPPGDTVVTFTATDTSDNSSTCQSIVEVVEAVESSLRIIPRIVNREGRLQTILAVVRFPVGTAEEDIDIEQPLVLYPGDSPDGVEATSQRTVSWTRNGTLHVSVFARFSKDDLTALIPEDGLIEMMVIGKFMDGTYFYGFDDARIISWSW